MMIDDNDGGGNDKIMHNLTCICDFHETKIIQALNMCKNEHDNSLTSVHACCVGYELAWENNVDL